jgi:hypothetical protein
MSEGNSFGFMTANGISFVSHLLEMQWQTFNKLQSIDLQSIDLHGVSPIIKQ